jgi:hypothetical protein
MRFQKNSKHIPSLIQEFAKAAPHPFCNGPFSFASYIFETLLRERLVWRQNRFLRIVNVPFEISTGYIRYR